MKRNRNFNGLYAKGIRVYSDGIWYLQVNSHNRQCQITSGDIWFDITRDEAVHWLRGTVKKKAA
jgi:hypothetical protein